ncbi:hypothetical protein E2562_010136 [Oryza meyeriana var. granulata]|uniref:[RNA-polymerase]-subunit kinase n=1 Tax=Oryza meyeriana var. granulata TaxID=110450 RepID=A0A6G1EIB6_9ORYZ|nr:hypothetical protein E2562_010136 [Oryza meyeriana var. granulata]
MGCVLSTAAAAAAAAARSVSPSSSAAAAIPTGEVPGSSELHGIAAPPRSQAPGTGWPPWLVAVAGDALSGWAPRRADEFEKIAKIGSGTYSNVYKARETGDSTGKVVALKKVRFEAGEMDGARFMAREITVLRRIGHHPNVVRLQGIACSRVSCALYLMFEYLDHDLTGILSAHGAGFSLSQVKCYMKQLLAGLDHCHSHGILHRDLKGSNLLLNNEGELKIADFGLASTFDPKSKKPMTSQVVTLWYRAPELLLGATSYGVGVDLWSAGCILAELLIGRPIFPGRTEVEQLHRIFKLCGSPPEKYWKKLKLQSASVVRSLQPYKSCIAETFKDVPPSAVALLEKLLAINPAERGTAVAALNSEFFTTEPYACDPSSLPKYPPTKEMDVRLLHEKARRMTDTRSSVHLYKRARAQNRRSQAVPAPEANAELQVNLNRWKAAMPGNAESKSEKFPPPHEDGAMGVTMNRWCSGTQSVAPLNTLSSSTSFGDSERRRR